MPFIEQITKVRSLSIVGLEKNTGKTECLNYILRRLSNRAQDLAVTSIGIDGEGVDRVTATPKPEILLPKDCYFVTVATFFRKKRMQTLIWDVETGQTALGDLITAQAMESGKMMLCGPAHTVGTRDMIDRLQRQFGIKLCLIDGALSRLSPASPAVTEAMILNTGAAVSANIEVLVRKTRFVYDRICLPAVSVAERDCLQALPAGIWALSENDPPQDTGLRSALAAEDPEAFLQNGYRRFYVSGAVGDKFLQSLARWQHKEKVELVVRDFTRFFTTPAVYYAFLRQGGQFKVLDTTRLLAVCINPVSPAGYVLNSTALREKMQETLQLPVYDIKQCDA